MNVVEKELDISFFSEKYVNALLKIATRLGWLPEKIDDKTYLCEVPIEEEYIFDILTDF